jgi:CheY-like chemotaxis protein
MPKVMIVDDDRTVTSLLRILFEMDGYEVANIARGRDMPKAAFTENPDLILMDVFLSDADGIKILGEIRQTPELADIRVVMTSGMDLEVQCMASGANAFLLKPYTPDQLMKVIRENLPGNLEF